MPILLLLLLLSWYIWLVWLVVCAEGTLVRCHVLGLTTVSLGRPVLSVAALQHHRPLHKLLPATQLLLLRP